MVPTFVDWSYYSQVVALLKHQVFYKMHFVLSFTLVLY